ncbi:GFA family protein [Aspergillus homomorphus CBS 101889]
MPTGSCFCGHIRINYTGQPITTGICHCKDCRKISGSLSIYSLVIQRADLQLLSGQPKEVRKTADSGNQIRNYFCGECGTPLYGWRLQEDGTPHETVILRAGILDDEEFLESHKPQAEIYTGSRLGWVAPAEGAVQVQGMVALP